MPELAEVEYHRKQWEPAIGESILGVECHEKARIFRKIDASAFILGLTGKTMLASRTHGKQMLFEFTDGFWLGLHLGMTGKLFSADPTHEVVKAEHFVLRTAQRSLVFSDFRMFGVLTLDQTSPGKYPDWWEALPTEILSPAFTEERVLGFLKRHRKSPLKPLLLNQSRFPGIGNWMADEITWRLPIHPATLCGDLDKTIGARLWQTTRDVTSEALDVIGTDYSKPPDTWLFNHRWKDGGHCPRPSCGHKLSRAELRGRTTCWCTACQGTL